MHRQLLTEVGRRASSGQARACAAQWSVERFSLTSGQGGPVKRFTIKYRPHGQRWPKASELSSHPSSLNTASLAPPLDCKGHCAGIDKASAKTPVRAMNAPCDFVDYLWLTWLSHAPQQTAADDMKTMRE